jgi:aryl-alcohol dehydrogenase-like predicted oxidoreductase
MSAAAAIVTAPRRFAPRREIGRTGFVATRIGAGDLADRTLPFEACVATLQRALDAGLNVVDTAPAYEDGLSERIVGAAVRGRPRGELFVIDKIDHLDQPVAPQIAGSLARLGLAHVDLFVFHGLTRMDDWRALAAPGGGFEQLARCVRAGQARFRGISCHDPDVLLAAIASGLCDVVMFPVGPFVDRRYLAEALPAARAAGVGTVSFKTFGAGMLIADTSGYGRPLAPDAAARAAGATPRPPLSVDECVRHTLTCDPDAALLGLSTPAEQDAAFAAAERFVPFAPDERQAVEARASAAIAGKGACWWNPGAKLG